MGGRKKEVNADKEASTCQATQPKCNNTANDVITLSKLELHNMFSAELHKQLQRELASLRTDLLRSIGIY